MSNLNRRSRLEYIGPVQGTGPITQGNQPDADAARMGETMNSVFRVYKYPVNYAALQEKHGPRAIM